jgi:hypothetical protein
VNVRNIMFSITLALTTAGCASVRCEHAIKYQGENIDVEGLNIPVGGLKTVSLAKFSANPEVTQQAKSLVQALDLQQFADCQAMILAPSAAEKISERRSTEMSNLASLLGALDSASTVEEGKAAVAKAATCASSPANPR